MADTVIRSPTEAERRRIQDIIDRYHERPAEVRDIKFDFGEDWAGYPAVYIKIFVSKDLEPTKENIETLNNFTKVLLDQIIDAELGYWPYARTLLKE
jgi:hypothetical protein